MFHIFVQVQTLDKILFNFLILGKSRFPTKKFYNIDYRAQHSYDPSQVLYHLAIQAPVESPYLKRIVTYTGEITFLLPSST